MKINFRIKLHPKFAKDIDISSLVKYKIQEYATDILTVKVVSAPVPSIRLHKTVDHSTSHSVSHTTTSHHSSTHSSSHHYTASRPAVSHSYFHRESLEVPDVEFAVNVSVRFKNRSRAIYLQDKIPEALSSLATNHEISSELDSNEVSIKGEVRGFSAK